MRCSRNSPTFGPSSNKTNGQGLRKELTNRGIRRTTRTEQPHPRRPRNPTASTLTNPVNSAQTPFNGEQNPTLVGNTTLDQRMAASTVNTTQEALNAAPINPARRAQSAQEARNAAPVNASLDYSIPLAHTNFPFSHSTSSSSVSAFIPVGCLSLDSFTVHGYEVFNRCSTSSIRLGPL